VNINASDVVDGKPAVVLGLIWTIILYFQVAETTARMRNLPCHSLVQCAK
jgi:nesprin-1